MPNRRSPGPRRQVALLIETSNAFSRELLHGVRDWMRERRGGWEIHLSEHGRGDRPPPWLGRWRGDGILARVETREIAAAVRATGAPVVNVSATRIGRGFPTVISDSAAIAATACEHLATRGVKSFGYCGDARFAWSKNHGKYFVGELAERGFGCVVFPAELGDSEDWSQERRKLSKWVSGLPKPCGVMACYDIRGQQVLDVCRSLGLRVPEDVAVIGQHNDELLCELCDPPLSSVKPDARRVGFEAASLLHGMIEGERGGADLITIPPLGVATRQSTDLVAVDDPRLAEAIRFVKAHTFDAIGVADLAKVAGMSRSLFERRFREAFGLSPWNYVLGLRLEVAAELLRDTTLTVAEIAERTGFGTAEHFSVMLRKRTGQSPGQLRRA